MKTILGLKRRIRLSRNLVNWIAVGLLLILYFQLFTSAVVKSPTFDEPVHAMSGYVYLSTHDWRMQNHLHPPLIHIISGALMWPTLPRVDPSGLASWNSTRNYHDLAQDIMTALGYPSGYVPVLLGRLVVIGFCILLGAVLLRWASEWYGRGAGLLALGVYVFSPNVLAHGRLITTDMVGTAMTFTAVYVFQRLMAGPRLGRLVISGLVLGLALASKLSAVILVPVFAIMIAPWLADSPRGALSRRRQDSNLAGRSPVSWLLGAVALALITLWAVYGFEVGAPFPGWPPLPLPTYMKTLADTFFSFYQSPEAPSSYLMGRRSSSGWWYYFPVVLLIKTPLPILVGSGLGFVLLIRERQWQRLWFISLVPMAYLSMAALNSWNLGYRHILPIEPFLILIISSLSSVWRRSYLLQAVGAFFVVWLVVGTLQIYPDYLAYFNEAIGGPTNGHRYLTDSNLDWGQDLIQLRDYMAQKGIQRVRMSYFGCIDPETFGIAYDPLPSWFHLPGEDTAVLFQPEPGVYAISATNLSGQFLPNPSHFDWFRRQQPTTTIGHSIHIYDVVPEGREGKGRIGACIPNDRSLLPSEGDLISAFGTPEVDLSWLTCTQDHSYDDYTWLIAAADQAPVVAPLQDRGWRLVYQQTDFSGNPFFGLYRRPEVPEAVVRRID